MAGKTRSRKRNGKRGECSYCGKWHKGGPKGNSCGGHSVKAIVESAKKPPSELDSDWSFDAPKRPNMNSDAVRRRERAAMRAQERAKRSDEEQLQVLKARGFSVGKEFMRLSTAVIEKAEAKSKKTKTPA